MITAQEVSAALASEKTCTLGTCARGRVTLRPMSHVSRGLSLFFQTGAASLKAEQMRQTPQVALLVGTYQLEGEARFLGHPLHDPENRWFADAYRQKHPASFAAYSALEDEVVVRVDILRAAQWRYADGKGFLVEAEFGADALKP